MQTIICKCSLSLFFIVCLLVPVCRVCVLLVVSMGRASWNKTDWLIEYYNSLGTPCTAKIYLKWTNHISSLLPASQSAFCPFHSTIMGLQCYIVCSVHNEQLSVLMLFVLSAASVVVKHEIFLTILHNCFTVKGSHQVVLSRNFLITMTVISVDCSVLLAY